MSNKKPLFYTPDADEDLLSDQDKQCPAVRDAQFVIDADDLARWRALWLPSCVVCPRQKFCGMSHKMQMIPPKMVI